MEICCFLTKIGSRLVTSKSRSLLSAKAVSERSVRWCLYDIVLVSQCRGVMVSRCLGVTVFHGITVPCGGCHSLMVQRYHVICLDVVMSWWLSW
jgi:hypothetical protein